MNLAAHWPEVTHEHVRVARILMGRPDWSLGAIAEMLGVSRSDLDVALWRRIDEPLGRKPMAMFQ